MAGLAPELPLSYDDADGFRTLKSFSTMVKQNFKMLLLTNPGERVMYPEYGVGMQRYLFEDFSDNTYAKMDARIRKQVSLYMPFIQIQEVNFQGYAELANTLGVRISFIIPQIGMRDLLEFTI
jgi:phage baseplate assembly protein W